MKKKYTTTLKLITSVFLLVALAFNTANAQSVPPSIGPTGYATWPPGWSQVVGSTDISSAVGFAGDAGFPWVNSPSNPPTGHTVWVSGGWDESSSTNITGLTIGVNYTFTFYAAELQFDVVPIYDGILELYNPSSGASLATYPFTGGNSVAWFTRTYSFTAASTSLPIAFRYSPQGDYGNAWNVSIASNAVAPTPVACTTPTALNCEAATAITAGSTATSTVTGGTGGNVTWAISPTSGVSTTSGSGSTTGAITFANAGTYTVTFTSTNNSSPASCSPAASVTCSRTITVNASPVTTGTVASVTGAVGSTITGNVPTASGGTAPYTFSSGIGEAGCTAVSGATALPAANLGAVNSSTGAHNINTTGLTAGTYYYCLKVCDASGTNCGYSSQTVVVTAAACGAGTTAPVVN